MCFLKPYALVLSLLIASLTNACYAADLPGKPGELLAVNDISWLLPMPEKPADFAKAISLQDVLGPPDPGGATTAPVWSDSAMKQYFGLASSKFGKVEGTEIGIVLTDRLKDRAVWHISGVRIDPGAPGATDGVAAQFGQQPQIRLIAQPVIKGSDGTPEVLDIAAHLVYSYSTRSDVFAQAGCFPKQIPNMEKVSEIARDVQNLKMRLAQGEIGGKKIKTGDVPLGIHPAFKSAATAVAFRDEILAFLNRRLPEGRLTSMAIAGRPGDNGDAWIFLAMGENPRAQGEFFPVPSPALNGAQFSQMLTISGPGNILPSPAPNNLNATTCQHAALKVPLPLEGRKGLATAELFSGKPSKERVREIVDLIGDPVKSHFFNTDCLSCHTDTRLGIEFLGADAFPGIDPDVLPKDIHNVRNLGWFPDEGPTATNRTLTETVESLVFFNEHVLGK